MKCNCDDCFITLSQIIQNNLSLHLVVELSIYRTSILYKTVTVCPADLENGILKIATEPYHTFADDSMMFSFFVLLGLKGSLQQVSKDFVFQSHKV